MSSGNVQNEMALVGKYKSGYTGTVPKEFTKPGPFAITRVVKPTGTAAEAYGYKTQESRPTPESPNYGAVYKK